MLVKFFCSLTLQLCNCCSFCCWFYESVLYFVSIDMLLALSHWCVSNRKKARQIVETWEKMFKSSQKEQCVPFLYLANDILQNSRRKGSDFVNEFWKVLPAALKHVHANGDVSGKKAATRLVSTMFNCI